MARPQTYHCSFCGKKQDQVQRLIAGPHGVYICDECVALCNEILAENVPPAPSQEAARPRATLHSRGGHWLRRLLERWRPTVGAAPDLA